MPHNKPAEFDKKILPSEQRGLNLLETHLRLLDIPNDHDNPEWHVVEGFRQSARRELKLATPTPSHLKRHRAWLAGAAAIAAGIAVMIFPMKYKTANDELAYKGNAKVFVIIETALGISIWDGKSPLTTGTKINAEILATQDAVAFAAVYDRSNRLLTSKSSILNSRLQLTAGVRAHFDHAFELTSQNDGEQLAIVICDKAALERGDLQALNKIADTMATKPDESFKQALPYCGVDPFTLRN